MTTTDWDTKRIQCGCHAPAASAPRGHRLCQWPLCLTEAEHHALVEDVMADWSSDFPFALSAAECGMTEELAPTQEVTP